MTIHRFFIAPQFINEEQGTILCQSEKLVKQIRKVLRLGNGDRLDILDGQGNTYHCILENISPRAGRDLFQAKIAGKEKTVEATGNKFTIAMPLIKTNRFEWALEKLTELGVDKIAPIVLNRSVTKIEDLSKLCRWHKIIEEASEQSERDRPPELTAPLKFPDWLMQYQENQKNSLRLICAERTTQSLLAALYNFKMQPVDGPVNCAIAIGAEGGFTEQEIQAALSRNFVPVSLGSQILRSETAAISALSISRSFLS